MPQEKPTKFNFNVSDFQDTPEAAEHTRLNSISADLSDFDNRTNELERNSTEFDKILDEIEANPTPENITRLRQANKNLEQNAKNPLEKHTRLASRFTKKIEVRIDGQPQRAYRINFANRSVAEGHLGLGDIMPPHLETVTVYNDQGELITDKAIRRINAKNRIGYYDFDSGAYIPIYHNYFAIPTSTRTNTKKDFTLAKRKMKEELALYNLPQDTGREEQQNDLAVAPAEQRPKKTKRGIPLETKEPKLNKKFPASRQKLKKMGYKTIRRVPVAVRKKADEILAKGNKIGTTTIIEIDGKKYAFRDEWHKHPESDRGKVPDSLLKQHHGVSVLEYRA